MKTYHASPTVNRKSILTKGLLASRSQQKRKAVWFHLEGHHLRAICHVSRYKRVRPEDIDLWECEVSEEEIRHHRDGWYYLVGNVPPSALRRVTGTYVLGETT